MHNGDGEHITCVTGSDGYAGCCDSEAKCAVQRAYWAEVFCCVLPALDLAAGIPIFTAEMERTDT